MWFPGSFSWKDVLCAAYGLLNEIFHRPGLPSSQQPCHVPQESRSARAPVASNVNAPATARRFVPAIGPAPSRRRAGRPSSSPLSLIFVAAGGHERYRRGCELVQWQRQCAVQRYNRSRRIDGVCEAVRLQSDCCSCVAFTAAPASGKKRRKPFIGKHQPGQGPAFPCFLNCS